MNAVRRHVCFERIEGKQRLTVCEGWVEIEPLPRTALPVKYRVIVPVTMPVQTGMSLVNYGSRYPVTRIRALDAERLELECSTRAV